MVYLTAFILGLVHSDFPLTDEIYARTTPNLMDLMIGLGGAAGGRRGGRRYGGCRSLRHPEQRLVSPGC